MRNTHRYVLAVLLLGIAASAQAATFTVTKIADTADGACDADCSLREAVIQSNQTPGLDTIEIPEGKYTISLLGQDDTAQAGDLDVTDALVILGKGTSAGSVVLSGGGQERVLDVFNKANLEMRNVMVKNGSANKGGGVYVSDGAAIFFDNVVFRANTATEVGGVIYFEGVAGSIIQNSTFTSNTSVKGGAVALVDSSVQISKSIFALNVAESRGGAIFVSGAAAKLTMKSDTLKYNKAMFGGGIEVEGGVAAIQQSSIYDNEASGGGGGIDTEGSVTIIRSTIAANKTPTGNGGGIYSTGGGNISLNSVTIKRNEAGAGAGIYNSGMALEMKNTLLIYNTNAGGKPNPDLEGAAVSGGNNVLGSVDQVQTVPSDQVGVPFDAETSSLVESEVAGGSYIPVMGASFAINKGDCSAGDALKFDQLGRSFVGACDVGAIESVCGDGVMLAQNGEECDDGNVKDGDKCSALCKIEKEVVAPAPPPVVPEIAPVAPVVPEAAPGPAGEANPVVDTKPAAGTNAAGGQASDTKETGSKNAAPATSSGGGCSLIR